MRILRIIGLPTSSAPIAVREDMVGATISSDDDELVEQIDGCYGVPNEVATRELRKGGHNTAATFLEHTHTTLWIPVCICQIVG